MATKLMRLNRIEDNIHIAPGDHGERIEGATIAKGEALIVVVDTPQSPHDDWVRVVGPNPPINNDGTYLGYGKPAWIKFAHLDEIGSNIERFTIIVEVNWNERTIKFL